MLVHDANLGDEALERGCVDLVLGGHLHVQDGPTRSPARTARWATPSPPARPAGRRTPSRRQQAAARRRRSRWSPTRDGRPVGIQAVVLQPSGEFVVGRVLGAHATSDTEPCPTRHEGATLVRASGTGRFGPRVPTWHEYEGTAGRSREPRLRRARHHRRLSRRGDPAGGPAQPRRGPLPLRRPRRAARGGARAARGLSRRARGRAARAGQAPARRRLASVVEARRPAVRRGRGSAGRARRTRRDRRSADLRRPDHR